MVYKKMADALAQFVPVVLVSVVKAKGSVPRGAGAQMAVFPGEKTAGTVGGGLIEHKATQTATDLLLDWEKTGKKPVTKTQDFNMDNQEAARAGMVCGGQATLFYQFFAGKEEAAFFYALDKAKKEQKEGLFAYVAEENTEPALLLYKEEEIILRGDFPQAAAFVAAYKEAAGRVETEEGTFFTEPLTDGSKVLLFGGGHVAQALAPVLLSVGFTVQVYEDREEYLTEACFPASVGRVHGDFTRIDENIRICPSDYVIIMTRGHLDDLDVLRQVLCHPTRYTGMIGSKRKVKTLFDTLREEGVEEDVLQQVYSPIGLAIAAETPEEIAVSITAEMIRVRATGA